MNNYLKKWKETAKSLSECADLMPTDLQDHKQSVYNACLDMAYACEEESNKKLEEIRDLTK